MTCPHGIVEDKRTQCAYCIALANHGGSAAAVHESEVAFWGTCDHGESLAPWMDCAECETREDDFDA